VTRSLRSRLMIGVAVTTTLVMAASTGVTYSLIRGNLYAEFDELLGSKARTLATMIEQDGERIDLEFKEHLLQEFARSVRPEYYQVWREDGTVLARSRRLVNADLPRIMGSRVTPGFQSIELPDGRRGRSVGMRFLPHVEGERLVSRTSVVQTPEKDSDIEDLDEVDFSDRTYVTLVLAHDTDDLERTLSSIFWLLCGSAAVTVCFIIYVQGWLVSRNLQPMKELAQQINELDEQSLSSRIHVEDTPSELLPVETRLNELIARLEAAFHREKTFTADMAHELRTPLSGIRSTLEVSLSGNRDSKAYCKSMQKCLRICNQTQRVVETLLSLARLESDHEILDRAFIDLEYVLNDCWETFDQRAQDRDLRVRWNCASGVMLNTDPGMFRLLIVNLMDNAVSYTDLGGTIEVSTKLTETACEFRIQNSGCHLSTEEVASVFDRLWRADTSRTETGVHAGLGLALCRRILAVLGETIVVSVTNQHFQAVVTFSRDSVEVIREDEVVEPLSLVSRMPMSSS